MKVPKLLAILTVVSMALAVVPVGVAQTQDPGWAQSNPDASMPIYKFTVNVVERTTKAINYRHRGGATKIDFRGTALLPKANGEAKVESKQGYIEIEVEFDELKSATRFGPEYLTYVMWAITPEGRATNLGEVILNGSRSKLDVTTELQAFGLIVTAEPYFAVSQPSNVVVMENVIREDTAGKVETIEAKYELLQRGQYTINVLPSELKPIKLDKKTPLDLYEARNALRIAQWAGASVYAAESFQKAGKLLDQAEDYKTRKSGSRSIAMAARQAVQTAEDARLISLQRQGEEQLANERAASAERELQANTAAAGARADADAASLARARAEADSAAARTQVERVRLEAEYAADRADRERAEALADSAQARMAAAEQAELARQAAAEKADQASQAAADRADRERVEALADSAQARMEAAEQAELASQAAAEKAEQARLAAAEKADLASQAAADKAERARLAAAEQAEQARQEAVEKAEREKQELRDRLAEQLNLILVTRDSARGLIINMSDVLFDSDRYSLRSGAREKLAKISGIVLAYPGLKLEVEGHTDSLGTEAHNQQLSENRAGSVRDFLVLQGINTSAITTRGFGENRPVTTNDTAAGRQENRRVEMVVSGDAIGKTANLTSR